MEMTRSTKVALVVVAAVLSLGFNARMLSWVVFAATSLPLAAVAASPVVRAIDAPRVQPLGSDPSCEEVVRLTLSTQAPRCREARNRGACVAGLETWYAKAIEDCRTFGR